MVDWSERVAVANGALEVTVVVLNGVPDEALNKGVEDLPFVEAKVFEEDVDLPFVEAKVFDPPSVVLTPPSVVLTPPSVVLTPPFVVLTPPFVVLTPPLVEVLEPPLADAYVLDDTALPTVVVYATDDEGPALDVTYAVDDDVTYAVDDDAATRNWAGIFRQPVRPTLEMSCVWQGSKGDPVQHHGPA